MAVRDRRSLFHALAIGVLLAGLPVPSSAAETVDLTRLFRTGKYAECVEAAATSLKQSDWQENVWLVKLQAEMELGRWTDAAASLDAALKRLPSSLQLRWLGRDVCRFSKQSERATKLEAEMVELVRQSPWRFSDSANQVVLGRWMLSQRTDAKKVLTAVYNEAKRRMPGNVDVWLAIGDLALEKHDYKLAGEAFQQAVKLDEEHPDAQLGVARAFAPSDSKKSSAALTAALAINPRHTGSLLMIADDRIDAERYDEADKALQEVLAVNPQQPTALAYRAVLAHLANQPEQEQRHRIAALLPWPENPAVDHLIGRKLSQKYRFAEGSEYQRQALEYDGAYLPAKVQLAQDLLRLGQEDAGLKLAEEVYNTDGYNVEAYNLVTLQESLVKFRTLEADGLLVRMDAREADVYGDRVLKLLQRAKAELAKKYGVQLEQPIIVEMFPRQQDFAIRTFGLPGGAGFLGVCFGNVITANSPASQASHPSCWEATLWHEFCHVVTLNKTKNKMPRWLSEGISVYEERLADPTWGQSINPKYREMMLGDDLTPVSKLSGAFLKPKSPLHVQFAYFESSLVVEHLIEKYGQKTLDRVLVDLGVGMPINESLARYTGSMEALDAEFAAFARKRAEAMGAKADWTTPELPRRATAEAIAEWLKEHPSNYAALRKLAEAQIAAKDWTSAQSTLNKMSPLYPEDSGPGNPYALLAKVHRATGDQKAERAALEKLASLTADLDALDRLSELAAEANDWSAARKFAERSLAVNPLAPATHRRAAAAALKLDDRQLSIASYRALLLLGDFNAAEAHFQLATLLRQSGDLQEAKKHTLLALEDAPRYRAAQQLLLEIVAALAPSNQKEAEAKAAAATSSPAAPAASSPATEEKKP